MKIANNLSKVELKKSEEAVTGKMGLGWMVESMRHFGIKKLISDEYRGVNDRAVIKAIKQAQEEEFTFDSDATYIDSDKGSAEYSYQGRRQMSGLLGCIAELGIINTVDYRRGNASPQVGILNHLRKACQQTEVVGKRIKRFRSDSAGAQDKIFTYCAKKKIEWYVTLDKNEGVKKAVKKLKGLDWKTMYGSYKDVFDKQWAVTEYVVNKGYRVRILILRWKNPDVTLFDKSPYCYHVIGTNNNDIEPMEWLEVHNGRMGTVEQNHKELKTGFGCDYTPSHDFEKNRGYFLLGVLAHNMVQVMKLFYLGTDAVAWTIKTIRYQFINVCGKIIRSGRRYFCKIINVTREVFERFKYCQMKMLSA